MDHGNISHVCVCGGNTFLGKHLTNNMFRVDFPLFNSSRHHCDSSSRRGVVQPSRMDVGLLGAGLVYNFKQTVVMAIYIYIYMGQVLGVLRSPRTRRGSPTPMWWWGGVPPPPLWDVGVVGQELRKEFLILIMSELFPIMIFFIFLYF